MPDNETEALVAYVGELLKATLGGKINWSRVNPSTFVWDKPLPPQARLVLQRVDQNFPKTTFVAGKRIQITERRDTHILNVSDSSEEGMNVRIDGSRDPRINEKLGAIYDSITAEILEKKLNFLKKTLPD